MLHKKVSVEKRNEFACEAFNRRNEIPKKLKLSKRYIEKLLRHYFCESAVEKFYDSEPDFDDEEYNMYLDYQNKFRITGRSFWELVTNMDENGDIANKKFSKQEHTPEEYKRAYEKVTQMYEAYEERRMNFNNWQELYEKGNWDMSQNYVDRFARSVLNRVRKSAYSKAGRIYYAEDKQEGLISIYICLRDIKSVDYFFDFRKKPKNKCRKR